jgi:hypothetical protein
VAPLPSIIGHSSDFSAPHRLVVMVWPKRDEQA